MEARHAKTQSAKGVVGSLAPSKPGASVVRDIVLLDNTVGKAFAGQEAQVTEVTRRALAVIIVTGKMQGKQKQLKPNQCSPIHPITLRNAGPVGRSPRTAAVAPGTVVDALAENAVQTSNGGEASLDEDVDDEGARLADLLDSEADEP